LRYEFSAYALIVLALLNFLRQFRTPPAWVRAGGTAAVALVSAAGLCVQGWYVWNFTRGHWVAEQNMKPKVVIIGAGPAGLTAGYLLSKNDVDVVVLEADPVYVGGISRTATYNGFHFDIGGHRFFSKSKAVEDLWTEILPNDMLTRPRSSRIFYGGKFFSYPLKPI